MIRAGRLRQLRDVLEVPRDLALGRYPAFVMGGPLPRGHVPVFCFHSLEPQSFGRKLEHLARNGYVTLSSAEYFAHLRGERPAPERAVVLTFDDGRSTVRTVAWPLMRRLGMKGIVFVVPGRVASRPGSLPPTLDDVEAGQSTTAALIERERGAHPLLSWEELAQLAGTGLFDIDSHTQSHAQIHIAPRLAGFLSPEDRRGYAPLEIPLVRVGEHDLFAPDAPLGAPLLHSAARLSDSLRYFEDPRVREACLRVVEAEGDTFFGRTDWEGRLRRIFQRESLTGRLETVEERDRAIDHELTEAARILGDRLGRRGRTLCYPWHVVGRAAQRMVRAAGYVGAFCGKVPGVPITPPGGDPWAIARIGEDYVERLPGRGRRPLASILAIKWRRRLPALAARRLP